MAIENGFYFGYMCIIESMAHLIQSFINDKLYHATIPYCSVELICKSIIVKSQMIKKWWFHFVFVRWCSIILVLHFWFGRVIEKNQSLNGYELYKKILKDKSVTHMGKEMPMYRALCLFLDDLKKV